MVDQATGEILTFKSRTNYPKIKAQDEFSEYKPLYEIKLDDRGRKKLVQNGQENLYEKIQEFKDDCDVEKIIQKATLGDTSVLEKRIGQYMDTTGWPKTIQESFEMVQKLTADFEKLPQEIKAEFDNSIYKFAEADKDKLEKAIRKVKRQPEPEKQPEKKQETKTEQLPGQISVDEAIRRTIKEVTGG